MWRNFDPPFVQCSEATAVRGNKNDTSEAANVPSFLRVLLSVLVEHVSAH
jgi:hypothetical protein